MDFERILRQDLSRISALRRGFLIADEVLSDTLVDFLSGGSGQDDLELALIQHRAAYDTYSVELRTLLREAWATAPVA